MANLTLKNNKWIVSFAVNKEIVHNNFPNIEQAADFMVNSLKVKDDEIDEALIEMYSLNMFRAIFNKDGELESVTDVL